MLRIACLCLLATGTLAIVCTPEICDSMQCEDVTDDNCAGVVKANGGFCGCCDACVIELAEGDSCSSLVLFGEPSNTQCTDGLYCGENSKCEKLPEKVKRDSSTEHNRIIFNGEIVTRPCDVYQRFVSSMIESRMGFVDPICDDDGLFEGMQIDGSMAYCVTTNGTLIDGYMTYTWRLGNDTSCQCARDSYDYMASGLVGKTFNCNPDGSYPVDLDTAPVYIP